MLPAEIKSRPGTQATSPVVGCRMEIEIQSRNGELHPIFRPNHRLRKSLLILLSGIGMVQSLLLPMEVMSFQMAEMGHLSSLVAQACQKPTNAAIPIRYLGRWSCILLYMCLNGSENGCGSSPAAYLDNFWLTCTSIIDLCGDRRTYSAYRLLMVSLSLVS